MKEPEWTDGNCYHSYGEFFAPDNLHGVAIIQWYRRYVKQCNGCPILDECLGFAMVNEEPGRGHRSGIWGGTSPTQREKLYKTWEGPRWVPRQKRTEQSEKDSLGSATSGSEDEPKS